MQRLRRDGTPAALLPQSAQGLEFGVLPAAQPSASAAASGIAPLLQQGQAQRQLEQKLSAHHQHQHQQFERQLPAQQLRQPSAQLEQQLTVHQQQLEQQRSVHQLERQLSGQPQPPHLWQAHSAVPLSQLRSVSAQLYPNASTAPPRPQGLSSGHGFQQLPAAAASSSGFGIADATLQQQADAYAGIAEAAAAAVAQQYATAEAGGQLSVGGLLQGGQRLHATGSVPGFGDGSGIEALLAERTARAAQVSAAGGSSARPSFDGCSLAGAAGVSLMVLVQADPRRLASDGQSCRVAWHLHILTFPWVKLGKPNQPFCNGP